MFFGDVSLDDAEGAILAHSLRLSSKTIKKGTRLVRAGRSASCGRLHECGGSAPLSVDDIPEDEAADRLATASAGAGISVSKSFTGRANLYAEEAGLVVYDAARLDALNLVDESVTWALVPPYQLVEAGQMIGTLKIITFAVSADTVTITEAIADRGSALVEVRRYSATRSALIQTTLPGTKKVSWTAPWMSPAPVSILWPPRSATRCDAPTTVNLSPRRSTPASNTTRK